MATAFVDTAGLIAITSARDGLHAAAAAVWRRLSAERCQLVTSQWVLTEFLGSMSQASTRAAALRAVDGVLASPRATIVKATDTSWHAALELYRSRPDKDWSLTDCSSILVCKEHGITRVLTADRHFVQAGLEVLL